MKMVFFYISVSLNDNRNDYNIGNEIYQSIPFDLNNHILILYSPDNNVEKRLKLDLTDENEVITLTSIYSDFKTVINKIYYDYAAVNNGVHPMMNLIGQSRGGTVNLLYATEYPERIDSMFSLGTLFNGSLLGSIINDIGYAINYETLLQDIMRSASVSDLVDPAQVADLKNNWNSIDHSNIKAYAFNTQFSYDFLYNIIIQGKVFDYVPFLKDLTYMLVKPILNNTLTIKYCIQILMLLSAEDPVEVMQYLNSNHYQNEFEIFIEHFFNSENKVFTSDGFVESVSQKAFGYDGIIPVNRTFTINDADSINHRTAPTMPAIPHNLQTRDPVIINYIVSRINLGNSRDDFNIIHKSNDTLTIIGCNLYSGSITIPNLIDGKTVTEIGKYSFAYDSYDRNLTTVTIPDTVIKIDDYAFYNCGNLTTIILPEGLTEIGDYAFSGCNSLQNIVLPSTLTKIGIRAFSDCTTLTSMFIPANLTNIEESTFSGCSVNYTVSVGNTHYSALDGTLYDFNKFYLIQYGASTNISFTAPSTVTNISAFAFLNACYLETINLNNITRIGEYAFYGSGIGNILSSANISYVGTGALDNTPWMENQLLNETGMIILGQTLINYNGDDEEVEIPESIVSIMSRAFFANNLTSLYIPDSVKNIGEMAFANCQNLEYVKIDSHIEYIGNMAFANCELLSVIDIRAIYPPQISPSAFVNNAQNRVIYIPYLSTQYYEENEGFENYSDSFDYLISNISFNSNGGSNCDTLYDIPYHSMLPEMPIPQRIGYAFKGWYDSETEGNGSGNLFAQGSLWSIEEDRTLYAAWEPNRYTLTLNGNGGTDVGTIDVYYELNIGPMPVSIRTGYEFNGWFDCTGVTQYSSATVWTGLQNVTLYAHWTANTYSISLNKNATDAVLGTVSSTVTFAQSYTLPVPTRAGYTFAGWYLDPGVTDYAMTSVTGQSLNTYGFTENKTFYAKWIIIYYSIDYIVNGGENNPQNITTYYAGINVALYSPQKIGSTFLGWYDNESFNGSVYTGLSQGSIGNRTFYAKWYANIFTITLDKNALNAVLDISSVNVAYDSNYNLPVPTREGYYFMGWYHSTSENAVCYTNDQGASFMPYNITMDTTYYAKWNKESYIIKLAGINMYLGLFGFQTTPTSLNYGMSLLLFGGVTGLDAIYRYSGIGYMPGHIYSHMMCQGQTVNWMSIPDLGNNGDTIIITPIWEKEEYTLILRDYLNNETTITAEYGTFVNLQNLTRMGYTFNGWYTYEIINNVVTYLNLFTNTVNTVMPDITPNEQANGTLYLIEKWTAKTYTLSYDSNGGPSVNPAYKNVMFDSDVGSLPNPSRNGYSFLGWNTQPNGNGTNFYATTKYNIVGNTTVYAIWQIIDYSISFYLFGGSANNLPSTYNIMSPTITLPIPSRTGSTFVGWYANSNYNGEVVTTIATGSVNNKYFYAKWIENDYTITFHSNGGSQVNSITKKYGEPITLPSSVKTGNTFGNWFTDDGTFNNRFNPSTMPASNVNIYAKWTVNQYTITFNSMGGPQISSITQDFATTVNSPTISSYTGFYFAGWFLDTNFAQPYTFTTMPANHFTLFAKWVPMVYTITYNLNGGVNNSANPTTYTIYDNLNFVNASKFGYVSNGWTYNGTTITHINQNTITGNITLIASWIGTQVSHTTSGNKYISDTIHIADCTGLTLTLTTTFYIESNVNQITFIGSSSKNFTNKRIIIQSRTTPLIIRFKDIKFTAPTDYAVIDASLCQNLTIECSGANNVLKQGSVFTNASAKAAIVSKNLTITGDSTAKLSIYGANAIGYKTPVGTRIDGQDGGNGIYADRYNGANVTLRVTIKELVVYGGDGMNGVLGVTTQSKPATPAKSTDVGIRGTDGINGADGGHGGKGGDAVFVYGCFDISNTSKVSFYGGDGGNGGRGANGQPGGDGGEGADGRFLFAAKAGGRGGDGGDAVDGGNGGASGIALIFYTYSGNVNVSGGTINSGSYAATLQNGDEGLGGIKGNPGARGLGGLGGIKYQSSNRASTGSNGNIGSTGTNGSDGATSTVIVDR